MSYSILLNGIFSGVPYPIYSYTLATTVFNNTRDVHVKQTVITKPKAESGNYQRERPMLHMLKLKSPENAR